MYKMAGGSLIKLLDLIAFPVLQKACECLHMMKSDFFSAGINSPLTPIPPMSKTSFDFSPAAISRCLEASKSTTPSVLKPRRNYTPIAIEISPPDISPIDFPMHSANRNVVSPNSTVESLTPNTM